VTNAERPVAVAGNQWITEYLLRAMIAAGHKPGLILNMAPERSKNISGYVDLGGLAEEHGIEIYRPKTYALKSEEDRAALGERSIEALFVYGWQRLIPEWLIERARYGVYGVHGGPEKPPRCRGRAVFNWAILLGYTHFYLYLFQITPEVDAGSIVELVEFDILPQDDVLTLYHKNCVVSTRMFIRHLPAILKGEIQPVPQPDEEPTHLPKRAPENGGIYWDQPARRIENLIRAVAPPYPGAFTFLGEMEVKIHRGHLFDTRIPYEAEPGMIVDRFPNGDFLVMAKDYPLYVRDYTCETPALLQAGAIFQLHSGEQPPDPIL
jgi:UDP-4-amino-4-deoxy-L-arabinose formyltransferase/UDP-glucuronic acid dehydrogenase (UDP-4-keto-hexauronic acid decarboxylating)